MKEILLHCCCAPCSSAIIEWMLKNDIQPTLYYCNPNIYPQEEYLIRKAECTRYAQNLGLTIIDGDYNHQAWQCAVKGLEDEPERGGRCLECFRMRLLSAARKTAQLGLDTFTTTLASSRWKRLDQINQAGHWAAEQVGVVFDDRNWRKGGLQERRNQLLKENGFYNQVYCGCEYSLAAREPLMTKDQLRTWIKGLKKAHTNRAQDSREICTRAIGNTHWQKAKTVLLYHALADEVDTTLLLESALQDGKQVLLPRVNGDDLTLHQYTGPQDLAPGAFGIMEPITPPLVASSMASPFHTPMARSIVGSGPYVDLAIVPGVAFDTCRHRLGRGKGYYDRLLPRLQGCYKIGISFPFQKLQHIPFEAHDIPMDEII